MNNNDILNSSLKSIDSRLKNIEYQLGIINNKIDTDVVQECKKMGSHIDFIEKVYANVKHPLGYITNKIKYLTASEDTNKYALPDIKND
jgi:hypothetical protein